MTQSFRAGPSMTLDNVEPFQKSKLGKEIGLMGNGALENATSP